MSAFGRFECKVSDDARYVEGEIYDIVLNGDMTYNHYTDETVPVVTGAGEPVVPAVVESERVSPVSDDQSGQASTPPLGA